MRQAIFKCAVFIFNSGACHGQTVQDWHYEWPDTDFSNSAIEFSEILSGGPPKDGIPAIDNPKFARVIDIKDIGQTEPVIYLKASTDIKAYPFRILMWHEIVYDTINNIPVTVTYCPLCNAAVIFDRRVAGKTLDFGVTGKLRHSDMIMYDRQTESWWQQFLGEAIVGEMTGTILKRLPAKIVLFGGFARKFSQGEVLISNHPRLRPYGENPYMKYDSSSYPFLYKGRYDGPGNAMSYIISVKKNAWLLSDIKATGEILHEGITIKWQEGMNSALDSSEIAEGRDIGFVEVYQQTGSGRLEVAYDMTFAFVFKAFQPDGQIHKL